MPLARMILAVIACLLAGCSPGTSTESADFVFKSGEVYTVNKQVPWASAVAVAGGRIAYVGNDEGVQAHIGDSTEVFDLAGRMLMPGFIDSHMHPMAAGTLFLRCDLKGLSWPDEIEKKVRNCAVSVNPGQWLRGINMDSSLFEQGVLDKTLLDEWAPGVPAFIEASGGSEVWVNSATLRMAGIDRETPDPVKGTFGRDPDTGKLTGVLLHTASNQVWQLIPLPDTENLVGSLMYASSIANSFGITSSSESSMRPPLHSAFLVAEAGGGMTLRIQASQFWDIESGLEQMAALLERREKADGGRYVANSVKLFLDGSANQQAAMLEPYEKTTNDFGTLNFSVSQLNEIVKRLDAEQFQVHMHAYGDAAVRQGLNALEHAIQTNPAWDRRHHLAHVALIDPADLPRFKDLGVTATITPHWAYLGKDRQLELESLGEERARRFLAFNELFASGARVAAGSDWISESMSPLFNIQVAVTRQPPDDGGPAWNPEQRVTLEQMLEAYTINGAWLAGLENETGSIEVGKAADLIILDKNLFETDPMMFRDVKVLLSLLDGEPVYRDKSFR